MTFRSILFLLNFTISPFFHWQNRSLISSVYFLPCLFLLGDWLNIRSTVPPKISQPTAWTGGRSPDQKAHAHRILGRRSWISPPPLCVTVCTLCKPWPATCPCPKYSFIPPIFYSPKRHLYPLCRAHQATAPAVSLPQTYNKGRRFSSEQKHWWHITWCPKPYPPYQFVTRISTHSFPSSLPSSM